MTYTNIIRWGDAPGRYSQVIKRFGRLFDKTTEARDNNAFIHTFIEFDTDDLEAATLFKIKHGGWLVEKADAQQTIMNMIGAKR